MSAKVSAKKISTKNVVDEKQVDSTEKSFNKIAELSKSLQNNPRVLEIKYIPVKDFKIDNLTFEKTNFSEQNKKNQESVSIGKMKVMPKINTVWVNYDGPKMCLKVENIIPVSRVIYLDDNEENMNVKFNFAFDPKQEESMDLMNYFKSVDEKLEDFCHGKNNFLDEQGLKNKDYKSWSEGDKYDVSNIEVGNPRTYPRKSVGFGKTFRLAIYSLDNNGNQKTVFKPQDVEGSIDIYKMINENCKPNRSIYSACLQLPSISFVKGNKKYSPKHVITNLTIFTCERPVKQVEEVVEFQPTAEVLRKLGINADKVQEVSAEEEKNDSSVESDEEYTEEEVSDEESEEEAPKKTLTKKN